MLQPEKIREAAREVVAVLTRHPVADDEALISGGLIDSLAILRMIAELEKRLGVSIPTDALQPEDFDNVDLIVETVQRVAR